MAGEEHPDTRAMEQRVERVLDDLGLDGVAMTVAANLCWTSTVVRNHLERGPLAQVDLTFSAFGTLWVLWANGEIEARHAAEAVGVARSSFTAIAGRLETRGLITRRRHPTDGRSTLFAITEAGEQLVVGLLPAMNHEERRITGHLSRAEAAVLAERLRGLADRVIALEDDQRDGTK